MTYGSWSVAPARPQAQQTLAAAGIPPLLAQVLSARGVETPQEALGLLDPQGEQLHPPLEMQDMSRAVARVRRALEGEDIAVYGDYDVDGITATCLLTDFLRGQGGRVIPYIPHRMEEGYGLNRDAVQELAGLGVTLIVTVDCGITAVAEVELARTLGVDVVITDHHTCKEQLPAAVAVVDPHRADCTYPFSGLAGVGVALKLAMAVAGEDRAAQVLDTYADLAAIGTVADVMPMTGENRALVHLGLGKLAQGPRLGLCHLLRESGLEEREITTVTIGYTLAPRINASGRMGQADLAVELLLTQDGQRAQELAQALCTLNRDRQAIEGEIFRQCDQRLEGTRPPPALLMFDEGWHQGVVGIVASRLAEKYGRPTFMVCLSEGMGKGSCRSWGGVNLFQLLQRCSDLLEGFGGHAMAAGFTVRQDRLEALGQRLCQELAAVGGAAAGSVLELDCAVHPEELTVDAIRQLDRLEPCGAGNPRPALLLVGATVQSACAVGRGRHLKLRLDCRGGALDAIWFSAGAEGEHLPPGTRVDVAFYPQINEFRGQCSPQLQVIDLRPCVTRAQAERAVYDKYCRGEHLSPEEAAALLPGREEFVRVWRYLKGRWTHATVIEDTPAQIARGTAKVDGRRETLPHTMVCLEVLAERGLIDLDHRADRIFIRMRPGQNKVVLEDSIVLRSLRRQIQQAD